MKKFYKATGVQPHLYITDEIYGSRAPSDAELDDFANEKYGLLFNDEAHFLFLVVEDEYDSYYGWYCSGAQADSVMDRNAVEILGNSFDKYYYQSKYSNDKLISNAFGDAAKTIMGKSSGFDIWTLLIVTGGVIIVIAIFMYIRNRRMGEWQDQQMSN
jgi:hypothetical protein